MFSWQAVVGNQVPALKAAKKSRSSVKLMTDLCYSSKFALLLLLFRSLSAYEIECPIITSKEVTTPTATVTATLTTKNNAKTTH
jgi:hypothetical protein